MATSSATGGPTTQAIDRPWDVDNPLVRVDRSYGPLPSVQVRHVTYPFVRELVTTQPDIKELLPIAYAYLAAANCKLELQPEQLAALKTPIRQSAIAFPLAWMLDASNPNHSQWIERGGAHGDRTALLLACIGFSQNADDPKWLLGGQGLRILVQVSPVRRERVTVRIAGVVSTVPPLPPDAQQSDLLRDQFQFNLDMLARLAASGLPPNVSLVDLGLAIEMEASKSTNKVTGLTLRTKTAIAPANAAAGPYATSGGKRDSLQLDVTSHAIRTRFSSGATSIERCPLIAFATIPAHAYVLASDPVSQLGSKAFGSHRPRKPSEVFNSLRSRHALGDLPAAGTASVELMSDEVRVRHVPLVDAPQAEETPKVVPADSNACVRSNEFTAVSAFDHIQSMFGRMRDHGLDSAAYFRFADLPVDVHYRAGIVPGYGDGRTVNAQVRWAIEAQAPVAPVAAARDSALVPWANTASARRLELRFALGDLQRTAGRLPANLPSAVERQPLGVAADVRWCWHEFGHVLAAAATGELELPFAHSVGDALAAVACDPCSALACDTDGAAANNGAWRFVTFPWVFIPRRHDRDVQRGWSWSAGQDGIGAPYGYRSEQLLSTTLFRLYRALGGDCMERDDLGVPIPASDEREQAARYTTYLIMRTLAALGPANVSPCLSVHQFVHAMRTVDAFTANTPGPGGYIGGSANKVIQWAFEQQGLYGRPVPGSSVMGPEADGQASLQVDLHIEDRRLQSDGPYTPVDLLGEAWQAAPDSITVQRVWTGFLLHRVLVRVDNRGTDPAAHTRIRLWHARFPEGSTAPQFPGPAWKRIWVLQPPGTVPGANGATPGHWRPWPIFWLPPVAGRYLLLLEASSAADRSHIDPATQFQCATEPGQVARLVAFDNNLGLAVVTV